MPRQAWATLERDIERRVCHEAAKWLGVDSIKLDVTGRRGCPDRLFLLPLGQVYFAEFKRPGAKPRPIQQYEIERLSRLGFNVGVFDNVEKTMQALIETIERMGASQLPEGSSEVLDRARRRWFIP